jgi:prepilin signal peptidase PulO-like enzyme (type II secretory pathway)
MLGSSMLVSALPTPREAQIKANMLPCASKFAGRQMGFTMRFVCYAFLLLCSYCRAHKHIISGEVRFYL